MNDSDDARRWIFHQLLLPWARREWERDNALPGCLFSAHNRITLLFMTRSEAHAAGLPYYDEGRRLCPNKHEPTKRWVSTGKCFWCARDYERLRRQADAPARTAKTKEWRKLNPDKVKAGNAKRDPIMLAAYAQRWRTENAEKYAASIANRDKLLLRATASRRRARKLQNGGSYTKADVLELLRRQKHRCVYCRGSLKPKFHVDHITPLARGGSNDRHNIQLLCPSCNHRKHAKHPITFARSFGLLL